MTVPYSIPLQSVRVYHEILCSKFIASLGHAPNSAAAHSFIQEIRAEFADASHNCWAFVAGPPGSTDQVGCSDDGEPRGTAGRPMLQTLQYAAVGEVAGVVTRYFGGTRLGRGGLVRAYAGSIKAALAQLPLTRKVEWTELRFTLGYAHLARLEHNLPRFEGQISRQEFGVDVLLQVTLPVSCTAEFQSFLQNLTAGQTTIVTCSRASPV